MYESLLPHERQAYDRARTQLADLTLYRDEAGAVVRMEAGGEVVWADTAAARSQ